MFGFNTQPAQPGSLNLSATGAPVAGQQSFGFAQPAMQPNPMMGGMMGGMGMTPQQQQFVQQPVAPPSELEILNALLVSQNPLHRFIKDGGLGMLIEIVAATTTLSLLTVLKDATFAIDEEEGGMKLDQASLPDNLKTLSAENVGILLNQMVANSAQTVQQAEMQRQQIIAMSQQSMMGGALQAALADEGMMEKVGGGIGSVARSFMGLPK
jgi:hypothetical protein|tara:strand:- start:3065 stop:3697 length:633 start_codon:yes stop_codon:yes gene_type:complete